MDDTVLKDYEVEEKCYGKRIAIYGAGNDGRLFYDKYKSILNIKCFVDRKKSDNDIPTISLCDVKKKFIIIICSRLYEKEIENELISNGYSGGKDYYIWIPAYTRSVKEYVDRNNLFFKKDSKKRKKSLLIPIGMGNPDPIIYISFFSNVIANNRDIDKIGYFFCDGRFDAIENQTADFVTKTIYKSFGVEQFVEYVRKDRLKEEASEICERVINKINCRDDWHNIVIDDVNYGDAIVETYIRWYELSEDFQSKSFRKCLEEAIYYVKWWNEYFDHNEIGGVLLWDGNSWDAFLRIIAFERNIPAYVVNVNQFFKIGREYGGGKLYPYFKNEFEKLKIKEKEYARNISKAILEKLVFKGNIEEAVHINKKNGINIFESNLSIEKLSSESINVVICPHCFEEASLTIGKQLYGNYISWLEKIGEMSEITDYGWYLKRHPDEMDRGNRYIDLFLKRYPSIKEIPTMTSPLALKRAGIKYALTICGSIGHEYPLIGINVINAGANPHMSFDFNLNPRTQEEYENIILGLKEIEKKVDLNELYSYYYIHYIMNNEITNDSKLKEIFKSEYWDAYNAQNPNYDQWFSGFMNCFSVEKYEGIFNMVKSLLINTD